jgi:hypothetical protein|tara:strand:+ start:417 stop:611 length:195 start_codon:yes stop_codon:yes gene_type:complete
MFRKELVSDKLDQLQLAVERLKSSLVVPIDVGDKGTPIQVVIDQLQGIEDQIDQIVNLIELEDD